MRSRFASPGSDYLERLGEVVYAVGSLEWLLLGDMHQHRAVLPSQITASALAGKTTTKIADAIEAAVPSMGDAAVAAYYRAGADALHEVAELRNPVLHARPATMPDEDGAQRLLRSRAATASTSSQNFWIDDAHLDRILTRIAELDASVQALRPMAPLP